MPSISKERKYRVLVVDDNAQIRDAHARIVRAFGYEAEMAADGIEAIAKLQLDIDLILLDAEMPHMDGFEVARRIREDPDCSYLPIIMVTGLTRDEDRTRALTVGVNDFILKPMDAEELRIRAKWLLELKSAYDELRENRETLERTVERRTGALRRALAETTEARRLTNAAHLETIRRLAIAAESRDEDTAHHIERIGRYAEILARAAGLSPREVELICHAAPMHDIGKIGIPDSILLKPAELTEEEWRVMRTHTTKGAQILTGSLSDVIQMGERIALTHHERWDGRGYPHGIRGEEIPVEGRICATVDFYDAVTMDRPYREAVPAGEVLSMMRQAAGHHFDPSLLDVFMSVKDEVKADLLEYQREVREAEELFLASDVTGEAFCRACY